MEGENYINSFIESAFRACSTEKEIDEVTGRLVDIIFDKADNRIFEINNK